MDVCDGSGGSIPNFKCRVCRVVLFKGDMVVDSHSGKYDFDGAAVATLCEDKFLWFLNEEKVPEWITDAIEEVSWTKGRIVCPKCSTRVGSFDFVGGSKCSCDQNWLPAIHVSRAKVDCDNLKESLRITAHMDEFSLANNIRSPTPSDAGAKLPSHLSVSENPSDAPGQTLPLSKVENSNVNATIDSVSVETDVMLKDGTTSSSIISGTSEECAISSRNLIKCIQRDQKKEKDISSQNVAEQVEPPEDLMCPICLGILGSPFTCKPCGHVFCEICLRCLAKSNPQNTMCPLCRVPIGICIPHSEKCQQIKSRYPQFHKTVQSALNKYRNMPLPWQNNYHLRRRMNRHHQDTGDGELGALFGGWFRHLVGHIRRRNIFGYNISMHDLLKVVSLLAFGIGLLIGHYVRLLIIWYVGEASLIESKIFNSFFKMSSIVAWAVLISFMYFSYRRN